MHTVINGDVLRAKLEKLVQKQNRTKRNKTTINSNNATSADQCFERRHTDPKVASSSSKCRSKQPMSAIDVSSPSRDLPLIKDETTPRCQEVVASNSSPYEKMNVPPPRQFQDVPPPPEPFRDPPESIDNILYYMYEAVLNTEHAESLYSNNNNRSKVATNTQPYNRRYTISKNRKLN